MPNIQVLPQELADKIAAGEVAERPSAVVKELVENSIDAGASSIEVEIRKGGIEYIRVSDNGCGIEASQVETAFLRHATSKLRSIDDLYSIGTMGFRGEALSSICAVANVEVITKTAETEEGVLLRLERGSVCERETIACGDGTVMVVENLFENIPARMKFLKKNSTEAGYVADVLGRIALSRPDIAFTYICDDKEVFSTSGDGKLQNVVLKLYGVEHAKAVIPVDYTEDNVRIAGVIGKPELARGNRSRQTLFVNKRYIKSNAASKVVAEGYRNSIMVGKFPFFVLNIEIAPECVDVNVHPAKTEIKFSNESRIYEILYHAVANGVRGGGAKVIPAEKTADNNSTPTRSASENTPKQAYTPSLGTYSTGREERVSPKLVREYLDSVIPKNEPENKAETAKTDSGMVYSDFNFLDEELPPDKVLTVREEDEPSEVSASEPEEKEKYVPPSVPPSAIGQIFDTYVLCRCGEEFWMIDQHAAHERARFERLKMDYYSKQRMSQMLLNPIILKLDFSEAQTVLSNLDAYRSFGFDIEDFGSGSIIVNATPYIGSEAEIRDLVLEIAEALGEMSRYSIADFEERLLDMIACKYAIKANRKLNAAEIQEVIDTVIRLESDGIKTCPHGRPIKIVFTKTEIEKLFKRRL